jgi:hypothetical protein
MRGMDFLIAVFILLYTLEINLSIFLCVILSGKLIVEPWRIVENLSSFSLSGYVTTLISGQTQKAAID